MVNRRYVWLALAVLPLLCGSTTDSSRDTVPPQPPRFAPPPRGVLFADDFSKGLAHWRPDRADVWTVRHRALLADLPDHKQVRSLIWTGDSAWTNYALDFDVCMIRGVDKGAVVRADGDIGIGVDLRGGTYQDVLAYVRDWPVGKNSATNANATWNHVRVEAVDDHVRIWVNGDLRIDRTQSKAKHGRIGLAAYTGGSGECTVYYDNVIVTAR